MAYINKQPDISIHDLVRNIFEACGSDFNKYVEIGEERKGKDGRYRLSSEHLRSTFSWEDKISLDEGICETIDWVKLNWNNIRYLSTDYIHKKIERGGSNR